MAEQEKPRGPDRSRIDELILTRVGDEAVIRPLDGVTMDEVKRYVQAERSRNRRAIVWTATLLLGVFLFFLVIFLCVGILVFQNRNETAEALAVIKLHGAQHTAALGTISNRVATLENVQVDLKQLLDDVETAEITRTREMDGVLTDLKRMRSWAELQSAQAASNVVQLDERLRDAHATTSQEVESVRAELERVLGNFSGARVAGTDAVMGGMVGLPDFGATAGPPPERAPDETLDSVKLTDGELERAGVFALSDEAPFDPGAERREIMIVNFPNEDRYEGELANGLMHGWGIYTYRNGDRYDGQFQDGLKQGRGTLVYANGDKYIGEFQTDLRAGRGNLGFANGDRYAGEFANDMQAGKGTMLYANGNKYAGNFWNGLRHGLGILRFANGDIYRGEFAEDARTGKGTYVFADGSQYIGDFVNGRRHGQGRYLYASGEEYEGEFTDGVRQGTGVSIFPNGRKIKGLWEGDRLVRHLDN